MERKDLEELAAQLSVDSIRATTAAGSGHPTSSMSAAHLAAVLFANHLRYDVADPRNRANDRFVLNVAYSYGGRAEILQAARRTAGLVAAGALRPEQITEEVFAGHLYTTGLPDPDLLIRTGGEQRVSNFLLWQLYYAEVYFTQLCWPDFNRQELFAALRDYQGRRRRFGAVPDTPGPPSAAEAAPATDAPTPR